MPQFHLETLEFALNEYSNADPEDQMSEGDRLLFTLVLLWSEEIQASHTTSQRLAEAYLKTVGTKTQILKHLQDFSNVFSKVSFDSLPNRKVWDHAIELELG